ncbi:MAG: hypothetical protein ACLPVY_19730 [Acidimicrobiia bacterium]
MSSRPRRFTAATSGAVVIVCVALATPAIAFASRTTSGVVVPKLATRSVTTSCPRGEHVSFGGVVAQFVAPPHSGAIVLPEEMRRTASNRWTVTGTSTSEVTGSRLTAVAYCDQGSVPSSVSNSVSVGGYRVGAAIATCPAGTVVVGGGYDSDASATHQEIVVRLQALSARQWAVTVLNISSAATTLTALAYCARSGVVAREYFTTLKLPSHTGGTARVTCPKSTSLAFGGLLANSSTSGSKTAVIAPFSWTAASTTQWVVTAYNAGEAPGSLDAFAYCR